MGIAEVLTIVFIVLKLTGVITWSWWLILLPEIIALTLYVIFYAVMITKYVRIKREVDRSIKNDSFYNDLFK